MYPWNEIFHRSLDSDGAYLPSGFCHWRKSGNEKNSQNNKSQSHVLHFFSHFPFYLFSQFNRIIAERTFIYQIVGNATFSVDTFFFISGLLVVLLFLRSEKSKKMKMEENCNENLINHGSHNKRDGGFFCASLRKSFLFIFYRFLRLSPVYLFIMAFTELSMK